MAIGTPTGTVSAANTSSTTAVTSSINTGSESNRTLFAVGASVTDGASRALSCTFGATSMDAEITREDTNDTARYRCSIFRLGTVTGNQTVTLTADGATDGIGVVAFYIDGVDDAAAEVTANVEDITDPHDISIGPGITTGALVVYGIAVEDTGAAITQVTASGHTVLAYEDIGGAFHDHMAGGWEEAGASGSEAGSWSTDGTGSFAGTLVAASFAPAAGATAIGNPGLVMAI